MTTGAAHKREEKPKMVVAYIIEWEGHVSIYKCGTGRSAFHKGKPCELDGPHGLVKESDLD